MEVEGIEVGGFILSTISALFVALVSVYVSHVYAQRRKFKSNFEGVITEIEYNVSLINELKRILDNDQESIKNQQKVTPYLLTELNTYSFNYFVLEGHFMKLPKEDRTILGKIYKLFTLINTYSKRYTENKYALLFFDFSDEDDTKNIMAKYQLLDLQILTQYIREVEQLVSEFIQKHSN